MSWVWEPGALAATQALCDYCGHRAWAWDVESDEIIMLPGWRWFTFRGTDGYVHPDAPLHLCPGCAAQLKVVDDLRLFYRIEPSDREE